MSYTILRQMLVCYRCNEKLSLAYWDEEEEDINLYFHSCNTWSMACPGAHLICFGCYHRLKARDEAPVTEQLQNIEETFLICEEDEDLHEITHKEYRQLSKDAMVILCNLKGIHLSDMLTWAKSGTETT
eukprot:jgi/Mesvir1/26820/Mv20579-RA.1